MILASTRCGLIACRYLAEKYGENSYISAPEIAKRYNINVRALMPALRQLTRSGILRSRVGGTEPGFILVKHPKEISLLEILRSLEGYGDIPCCKEVMPGLRCDCRTKEECCVYKLFNDITNQMRVKLAHISLEKHAGLLTTQ